MFHNSKGAVFDGPVGNWIIILAADGLILLTTFYCTFNPQTGVNRQVLPLFSQLLGIARNAGGFLKQTRTDCQCFYGPRFERKTLATIENTSTTKSTWQK